VPPIAETSAPGDAALVRRVQGGDLDAFEPLYDRYGGRAYALCLRLTGDATQAAELVQDVFVRVWEKIGSFRGDSAFSSWFHRLTVNVVLQALRSGRRRDARVVVGDIESDPVGALASRPPTMTDVRLDLEAALARLPEGPRVVFVLHEIEGYSHDEIAAMTGRAAGTVRSQLWKARQLLMTEMSR
jgi:RNA polymerase sigma-70 factor (ECF subfamily)